MIRGKASLAVTERELALGEAERGIEKACHAVDPAFSIGQCLAQHHIAATFAMNGPGLREPAQPLKKARCCRNPPGVQLGVASRKPAKIASLGRRLTGERGKEHDLRARLSPAR